MNVTRRLRHVIGLTIILVTCVSLPIADAAVCWFEASLFRALLRHAGPPDDKRIANLNHVEPIVVSSFDATKLRGFVLRASSAPARRLLLFAQGDGTLADEMVAPLTKFQAAGYDVFIFDYRGFGRSEGKPSIEAIGQDYEAIISYLSRTHPGQRFYYGISGGGIILLRALRKDPTFAGLSLDSTPSRMPLFCDSAFFPVNNVPAKAKNVLMIQAKHDTNVPPSDSDRLAEVVRSRGGDSILINASHPSPELRQELSLRFDVVERYFNQL